MAIDYARLKAWPFPDVTQKYTANDAILYALGVGLGRDPMDTEELRFVYEDGIAVLLLSSRCCPPRAAAGWIRWGLRQ